MARRMVDMRLIQVSGVTSIQGILLDDKPSLPTYTNPLPLVCAGYPVPVGVDDECTLANLYGLTFYQWAKWMFINANNSWNGLPSGDNQVAIRTVIRFNAAPCHLPGMINYVRDYAESLLTLDMESYGVFALNITCAMRAAITDISQAPDFTVFAAEMTNRGYPQLAALAPLIQPDEWNRGANYYYYALGAPYEFTGLFSTDCADCV